MAEELFVSASESGQKLLNFLTRRVEAEQAELHRWIRSGQVRVNKGRAKAFDRVTNDDCVRVPPFAVLRDIDDSHSVNHPTTHAIYPPTGSTPSESVGMSLYVPIIYENEHILVLNKTQGLACQGGTGQEDDVASMLKRVYAHAPFIPAPAHRLDKHSSGLLFCGKSYDGLRYLSDFMHKESDAIPENGAHKEYFAWVHGDYTKKFGDQASYMLHYVYKGKEKMHALNHKHIKNDKKLLQTFPSHLQLGDITAQKALSIIKPLKMQLWGNQTISLLNVGIFTGRTHQIRLQCADIGFPLVGDGKYGTVDGENLKLHAHHLQLQKNSLINQEDFYCLPSHWQDAFLL